MSPQVILLPRTFTTFWFQYCKFFMVLLPWFRSIWKKYLWFLPLWNILIVVLVCKIPYLWEKTKKLYFKKCFNAWYKLQNLGKHLSTVYVIHAPSNLLICEPSHAEKAWENILSFNPFHAKNIFWCLVLYFHHNFFIDTKRPLSVWHYCNPNLKCEFRLQT